MKLYLVIYLAGLIGGSVGPLPYDMQECRRRAAEMYAEGNPNVVTPQGYTMKDVRFSCEWRTAHPENNPLAGKPR